MFMHMPNNKFSYFRLMLINTYKFLHLNKNNIDDIVLTRNFTLNLIMYVYVSLFSNQNHSVLLSSSGLVLKDERGGDSYFEFVL